MSYKITIEADSLDEFHEFIRGLAARTDPKPRSIKNMLDRRQFTPEQVVEIRNLRSQGHTVKSIANQFDVAIGTITQIVNRMTYRDIHP